MIETELVSETLVLTQHWLGCAPERIFSKVSDTCFISNINMVAILTREIEQILAPSGYGLKVLYSQGTIYYTELSLRHLMIF
jgi:hypothetical protein